MTDPVAIALIGGLPLTIAALGAFWQTMKNGAKSDVIIGHVNSEKTELVGKLAGKDLVIAAKDNVIAMQAAHIEDLKRAAGLLAQAQAARTREGPIATTAPAVVESLDRIDHNTKNIEMNTAKDTP
jgi:hypothetical protein